MITDADVRKLEKVFATKKDLIGFATKKDISSLDGKIDSVDKKLDRTINYINLKFNSIEEKLTKLDSIDSRLDSVMESLTWLTGEYKRFGEEYLVASEQTIRVNKKLDNHEERISGLEQRVVTP